MISTYFLVHQMKSTAKTMVSWETEPPLPMCSCLLIDNCNVLFPSPNITQTVFTAQIKGQKEDEKDT